MLTSEHVIVAYERGRARPDRLVRGRHDFYIGHAEKMLAVYRTGTGQTRRELHRSVDGILAQEPDCPSRRIDAFKKLLDDASVFDTDEGGRAADLRLRVFEMAASHHPLVRERDRLFEHTEVEVKEAIARELGQPWPEIEAGLYADVMQFQPLREFIGYPDATALLSRYNVAQVQAALYRAVSMTVEATDDFKTILRYAKLARLMHEIRRVKGGGYRIDLSGPASVLSETRRYGVNLARFVPALLACKGWKMTATVETPWGGLPAATSACLRACDSTHRQAAQAGKAKLALSDEDGLRSHLPPPEEFDSSVEEGFARKWGDGPRDGWTLHREAAIVHHYQTAFVPDFVFRHEDGTEVLFEIVGFWSPEYLARKREIVRLFRRHRILLAVPEQSAREGAGDRDGVIVYKTALTLGPVLEALNVARCPAGPRGRE